MSMTYTVNFLRYSLISFMHPTQPFITLFCHLFVRFFLLKWICLQSKSKIHLDWRKKKSLSSSSSDSAAMSQQFTKTHSWTHNDHAVWYAESHKVYDWNDFYSEQLLLLMRLLQQCIEYYWNSSVNKYETNKRVILLWNHIKCNRDVEQ